MPKGILLLVSGPSGSGKSTLCRRLEDENEASFSVSCTTRAPRTGEVDKKDYYFIEKVEFLRRIAAGDFIEYAEVHGNYYGTLRSEVVDRLIKGLDVMMDVDVQGAHTFKTKFPQALTVFILPPSIDALRQRLVKREGKPPKDIDVRLQNAEKEMNQASQFDHQLTNDDFNQAYASLKKLIEDYLGTR